MLHLKKIQLHQITPRTSSFLLTRTLYISTPLRHNLPILMEKCSPNQRRIIHKRIILTAVSNFLFVTNFSSLSWDRRTVGRRVHCHGEKYLSILIDISNGTCATPCDYGGRRWVMAAGLIVESPSCFHSELFRNVRQSASRAANWPIATRLAGITATRRRDPSIEIHPRALSYARTSAVIEIIPARATMSSSWLVIDNHRFILWIKNWLDRELIGFTVSVFRQWRIFIVTNLYFIVIIVNLRL